jgi:flagellar motor switch protein FliN/FliY
MTDEQNRDISAEPNEAAEEQVQADAATPGEAAAENESPDLDAVPADDAAGGGEAESMMDVASPDDAGAADNAEKVVNEGDASEEDAEAAMMAMLEDLPSADDEPGATADDIDFSAASVSRAEFQQLSGPAGKAEGQNIELLMDVDLPVAIELGRTKLLISEILSLGPGSVVELNKLAGEPVDLLVNNKVVARGEVVVVDENFGLRITQLMNTEERLKSLGKE